MEKALDNHLSIRKEQCRKLIWYCSPRAPASDLPQYQTPVCSFLDVSVMLGPNSDDKDIELHKRGTRVQNKRAERDALDEYFKLLQKKTRQIIKVAHIIHCRRPAKQSRTNALKKKWGSLVTGFKSIFSSSSSSRPKHGTSSTSPRRSAHAPYLSSASFLKVHPTPKHMFTIPSPSQKPTKAHKQSSATSNQPNTFASSAHPAKPRSSVSTSKYAPVHDKKRNPSHNKVDGHTRMWGGIVKFLHSCVRGLIRSASRLYFNLCERAFKSPRSKMEPSSYSAA